MADIAATVRELNSSVTEIHIVEHAAECKELLILIDTNSQPMPLDSIPHHVGDLIFTRAEEQQTAVEYCAQPRAQQYLYEPPAAILKAGCTKLIAHRYGIQKLSPDSHLYINNDLIPDFPGRSFQIETILDFNKSTIRQLSNTQANLTVRGFPSTVAQLRKQLKLRDGGNKYIFACTTASHHHILLYCNRVP